MANRIRFTQTDWRAVVDRVLHHFWQALNGRVSVFMIAQLEPVGPLGRGDDYADHWNGSRMRFTTCLCRPSPSGLLRYLPADSQRQSTSGHIWQSTPGSVTISPCIPGLFVVQTYGAARVVTNLLSIFAHRNCPAAGCVAAENHYASSSPE